MRYCELLCWSNLPARNAIQAGKIAPAWFLLNAEGENDFFLEDAAYESANEIECMKRITPLI